MTNFLLRRFIPDYQNTADPAVREKYGNLAGIVGIIWAFVWRPGLPTRNTPTATRGWNTCPALPWP